MQFSEKGESLIGKPGPSFHALSARVQPCNPVVYQRQWGGRKEDSLEMCYKESRELATSRASVDRHALGVPTNGPGALGTGKSPGSVDTGRMRVCGCFGVHQKSNNNVGRGDICPDHLRKKPCLDQTPP